jgi:hypothetical protein
MARLEILAGQVVLEGPLVDVKMSNTMVDPTCLETRLPNQEVSICLLVAFPQRSLL